MHRHLSSCSMLHFYFFPSSTLRMSQITYERDSLSMYSFYEVPAVKFDPEELSGSLDILFFKVFLLSPLVWWWPLPIFPSIYMIFDRSVFFLIRSFHSYGHMSFPDFHYQLGEFYPAKSHPDCIFSQSALEFPILFVFWLTIWCCLCVVYPR